MAALKMTITEPSTLFRTFVQANDMTSTMAAFLELCAVVNADPTDHAAVYAILKSTVQANEARTLWRLLDNRAGQSVYDAGHIGLDQQVLVIGAGPCGLRMAIEVALLGGRAVVVEMRDHISRNNVLHLWPFVIHDLKLIGAKVFYPKFCGGNREHVSILRLQLILLKIALVLGVQVYSPVTFHEMQEPTAGCGWRARVSPEDHPVASIDFDAVVAADGKGNSLKSFKRKVFRGKLALGITANFVNNNTTEDKAVDEIGGLFYVYSPAFFDNLRDKVGVELENFVYFKDETHYFVMTARKRSLLKKGVFKQDLKDSTALLSGQNVDHANLVRYVREAADVSTDHQLAGRPFATNHNGQEDVSIFDFTALSLAEHACMVMERGGKKLLLNIVGDSLIEPFWPTGSGVAKGFLSVLDTAWLLRGWFLGDRPPLELIAERETIFRALPQAKPDNLGRNMTKFTIDPTTRYGPGLVDAKRLPNHVQHLYVTTGMKEATCEIMEPVPTRPSVKRRRMLQQGDTTKRALLTWYQKELSPFKNKFTVNDLSQSWRNGRALLAFLSMHRPELIDANAIDPSKSMANNRKAFDIIQQEFGIAPVLSPIEMASSQGPDQLSLVSYLSQLQHAVENERSPTKEPKLQKHATTKKKKVPTATLR